MSKEKTCFITGTSGYIGGALISLARSRFSSVISLNRSVDVNNPEEVFFKLGEEIDSKIFKKGAILIHCSYDFSLNSWDEINRVNVEGTLRLIESALEAGVEKVIYLSSISACPDAKSLYGKAKYVLEQKLATFSRVVIVKPGMVFGGRNEGTFETMKNCINSLPAIPLIIPSGNLHACFIDDLAEFIFQVIEVNLCGLVFACSPDSMSLGDLIKLLQRKMGTNKIIIPILWWLPWIVLRSLELIRVPVPFRSDAILGMVSPTSHPEVSVKSTRLVNFRNFDEVIL